MFQGREKVWWMIEVSGYRCSRVERRSGGWLRHQVTEVFSMSQSAAQNGTSVVCTQRN